MTDLDKRIAEMQGFTFGGPEHTACGPDGRHYLTSWFCWSTSDAKALELVDEMAMPFELLSLSQTPSARWLARFHYPVSQEYPKGGVGATRPEAICRAYIAAREWMATKAGA